MALFKILSNMTDSSKQLPQSYHQGYCYFDVNTGKFWIDTTDAAAGRMAINAYKADIATLANATIYETTEAVNAPLHKINTYYGHGLSLNGTTLSLVAGDNNTTLSSVTLPPDTHWTTHLYAGDGTAANKATANGNTKITITDNNAVRNSVTIKGSGTTSVTSDANGVITISSADSKNGTVTKVSTGVGLTGGDITGSGTIKAKLKTETAFTEDSAAQTNTANRQYMVGVDKSGYLSVNVPWGNTDTKVTSVENHYTPTANTEAELTVDASSTTAATWNSTSLVTGVNIQRDAKGHVTGVTVDSIKMPANPNSNTATAADNILDGSNSGTQITYAPYTAQQSKLSFDTSTTAPTRTDRLNLNGYLYATKLYSGGHEVLTSHQSLSGYIPKSTLSGAYDIMYSSAANTPTRLAANTTTTKKFLSMTGTGSAGAAPSWASVTKGDVGLGNVENTALSSWAGTNKITTLGTIGTGTWQGSVIGASYLPTATTTAKGIVQIGSGLSVSNGTVSVNIADLGLSTAMRFKGITTTAMSDGLTTAAVTIDGNSYTPSAGDVVLYSDSEFVWTGSAWERLGRDSSFKVTQTAVNSPSASGSTTAFIDTISQNANGVITVTKKNLDTSGTWSGNAMTATTATKDSSGAVIKDTYVKKAGDTMTGPLYINALGKDNFILVPDKHFGSEVGSVTGAIKITLPVSWTATMMSMKVDIYDYKDDNACTYTIGGYNYTGGYWTECSAQCSGFGEKTNLKVRFGHDGSKCCIIIGETNTSWSYPKVVIRNIILGHSGTTLSNWSTGWDIGWITTLPDNIDVIKENTNITANYPTKTGIGASGTWGINITGSSTSCTGNATTATKFASAQLITLTGDVTGSASSQAGWSIATTLANSGVTANTYGNTSQQTPSHGGTFNIPYFKVDTKGRVTQAGTTTVKLPADSNTDTKNTAGSTDTSSKIFLIGAASQATDIQTYSDNEVFATNGVLTAKTFNSTSLTASQAVVTDANKNLVSRGIRNNTLAGNLGWTSDSTDITLTTTNTIAYWNGAYRGVSSNLQYSKNGEIMGLSTAQTVSGTKTFSAIQKFTNTTDSTHSKDTAAAISTSGGISVEKQLSAKSIRIDNNQTSVGVQLIFDATLQALNFVFA